jgi:HEAT repeat protein
MIVPRSCLPLSLASAAVGWLALGAAIAAAQTRPAASRDLLPFGPEQFTIPPAIERNDTPPRVVQLLTNALAANPTALQRVELVRDLGQCKMASALPAVLKAASDPDPAVRAEAARSLALIGDRAAAESGLQKLLSDAVPAVRREAVRAGAALNVPSLVTAGLNDANESVFTAACAVAATAEHANQIATRMPSLSPQAKLVAVRALGRQGAVALAQLVTAQLASKDVPLTIAAIEVLGQMKAASESAAVREILGHPHPTARRAAVITMSALAGADEQIAIARRLLGDADLSVRAAAVRLLAAHPSPDLLPSLVAQLGAGHRSLGDAARDALVAAGNVDAQATISAATKLLDDADPRRREDGSFVLGRLRSDAAYERHLRLLEDPDWQLVSQAAESLGLIGRPEAAPRLAKIAARSVKAEELNLDDAAQVHAVSNAFIACGQLRYKPVLESANTVIPAKRTYSVAIRAPAIWAAGAASDADNAELASALLSVARDNGPFEADDARFEAIKAVGNMGYKPALDGLRRDAAESLHPRFRWMSHIVADRLAGTKTPYVPPEVTVTADTSIRDLTR